MDFPSRRLHHFQVTNSEKIETNALKKNMHFLQILHVHIFTIKWKTVVVIMSNNTSISFARVPMLAE